MQARLFSYLDTQLTRLAGRPPETSVALAGGAGPFEDEHGGVV
jgi:hypothetical protein